MWIYNSLQFRSELRANLSMGCCLYSPTILFQVFTIAMNTKVKKLVKNADRIPMHPCIGDLITKSLYADRLDST